jgi:hypothetical protein
VVATSEGVSIVYVDNFYICFMKICIVHTAHRPITLFLFVLKSVSLIAWQIANQLKYGFGVIDDSIISSSLFHSSSSSSLWVSHNHL